jgi:hypothetical protein
MYAQVKFAVVASDPPVLVPATALVVRPDGVQVGIVSRWV